MEARDNMATTIDIAEKQERINMEGFQAGGRNPSNPPTATIPEHGRQGALAPDSEAQVATDNSSDVYMFWKIFFVTLFGIVAAIIFLGVPISMIIMGTIYKDDCPMEYHIPIYLIVGGAVGLFKNMTHFCQRLADGRARKDEENTTKKPPNIADSLMNLFLFAWFIAGSVWIYAIHIKFQTEVPDQDDYCDPTLYWYAFWITTVKYIITALAILFGICFCIIKILCGQRPQKEETNRAQN